ncbi:MAG: hypothetical protein NT069_15640, partial [Planctomycetota bacterium]|nr:hypothetical protein [Planctomycetota bacterium]
MYRIHRKPTCVASPVAAGTTGTLASHAALLGSRLTSVCRFLLFSCVAILGQSAFAEDWDLELPTSETTEDAAISVSAPTPAERAKRGQSAARESGPQSDRKILSVLEDPAPEVRLSVLEALSERTPSPELRSRVEELATSDESPLVRGRARILKADWSLATPVDSTSTSDGKATARVQTRSRQEAGKITPRVATP